VRIFQGRKPFTFVSRWSLPTALQLWKCHHRHGMRRKWKPPATGLPLRLVLLHRNQRQSCRQCQLLWSRTNLATQLQNLHLMPDIRPNIDISTAPTASSSLSGTAIYDASSLGSLPEREAYTRNLACSFCPHGTNFVLAKTYENSLEFSWNVLTRRSDNVNRTARPLQNYKREPQIVGSFPSPRPRPLFPLVAVFMVGQSQLHANFEVTSFSHCTNIKGEPRNLGNVNVNVNRRFI